MTCVNMIYYHLIAWLGDRGLNSQDHLLRPGSPPDLSKYALWRRWRQVPNFDQVCKGHVDLGQMVNKLSGILYRRLKGYTLCIRLWLPQLASNPPRYSHQCMRHIAVSLVMYIDIL